MREKLHCKIKVDEITKKACEIFDYKFEGECSFELPNFDPPKNKFWQIGLIVGPSGSGKTQILKKYFKNKSDPKWKRDQSIISHFSTYEIAITQLSAVGLNSVPSWCKPYHVLSNGEQFRARAARILSDNATFDEWTSVVDRNVAKSCSNAIQKHIRKSNLKNIVFSTCHYDVAEWLEPDWTFDTSTSIFLPRGCLQRQSKLQITIESASVRDWEIFKRHHYLSNSINQVSRCFTASLDSSIIAFIAILPLPHPILKNAYKVHRLVVLPDYQGLGIGMRFTEWIGEKFLSENKRLFFTTSHPWIGKYQDKSVKWKATSSNHKKGNSFNENLKEFNRTVKIGKFLYSHEYVGDNKNLTKKHEIFPNAKKSAQTSLFDCKV